MPKPYYIFFAFFILSCSQPTAVKLELHNTPTDTLNKDPHQLTILIFADSGIYAYPGADLQSGKRYTPGELKEQIQTDTAAIVIKPSSDATYKNTVNTLDIMILGKKKKYALVDITPKEQAFLTPHRCKRLSAQ